MLKAHAKFPEIIKVNEPSSAQGLWSLVSQEDFWDIPVFFTLLFYTSLGIRC